jgi:hypothetical protein
MAVSVRSLVSKGSLGSSAFYITAPDGKRKLKVQTIRTMEAGVTGEGGENRERKGRHLVPFPRMSSSHPETLVKLPPQQ